MLDIGWQELFIIAAVLIIFVNPRDIPKVIVGVREFMQKMRAMAREFHSTLDDLIEESQIMTVKEAFDKDGRDIMADLERRMDDIGVEPKTKPKRKAVVPKTSAKKAVKKTQTKTKAKPKPKAETAKAPKRKSKTA